MSNLAITAFSHQELRRRILAQDPDLDEQTLADTLEGLTDLHGMLSAIIRSALLDESLADGLKSHIARMQDRLARLQERAQKRRQVVAETMAAADIKKITTPDFTASLRSGSPGLVVSDEKVIPGAYWEPRPPRLNRTALLAELRQGGLVAGAQLSNPEPVLSVRTK
jgi:hypothetical protein